MKKILKTNKLIINFVFKATLYLIVVFAIHLAVLAIFKKPLFEHQIILAYGVNYLLAILIFTTMLFFSKKANNYLGYIFMYGSLFKFTIFFIFFYPNYNKTSGLKTRVSYVFYTLYIEFNYRN